jgi:hypothetical protein
VVAADIAAAVPAPLRATSGRRLSQASLFNDSSVAARTLRTGFASPNSDTAGMQGLAVGPGWLLHGSGTVLSATPLSSSTGAPSGASQQVSLSSLFATVADGCTGGVYDPDVVYDHHARRFLVSATCGGDGRALLAVSSSSNPTQSWFLFGLVADAVNTRLACTAPVEAGMVDATRLTYNRDGVFLSLYSYCPSNPTRQGALVLALPKSALVKGQPNFFYAVYTSAEVVDSVAAAGGPTYAPDACRQLQPVVPQQLEDVRNNTATFLCEVSGGGQGWWGSSGCTSARFSTGISRGCKQQQHTTAAAAGGSGSSSSSNSSSRWQQQKQQQQQDHKAAELPATLLATPANHCIACEAHCQAKDCTHTWLTSSTSVAISSVLPCQTAAAASAHFSLYLPVVSEYPGHLTPAALPCCLRCPLLKALPVPCWWLPWLTRPPCGSMAAQMVPAALPCWWHAGWRCLVLPPCLGWSRRSRWQVPCYLLVPHRPASGLAM